MREEQTTTLLSITWAAYHGRPYMYEHDPLAKLGSLT